MGEQNKKTIRLLIIDDSEDDAFEIERELKKSGWNLLCKRVDSPKSLGDALTEQHWDIALCDIQMPLLTPEQVLKIMKQKDPPETPIILMSGVVDIGSLAGLIRGGVRDFLPKDQISRLSSMVEREYDYLAAMHAQQAEHELFIEAQKMEAVGTLAGGIAHDFNNILTALLGMQWKVKERYQELPELGEKMDQMDELCQRASGLVKQLLGFARKGILQLEDIELGSFITDNLNLFRMSIPEDIFLHWQQPNDAINIKADSTQLQQMLINLINNARDATQKATQPCISIDIEMRYKDNNDKSQVDDMWACVTVSNNGDPISKHVKEHIFEPFYTTKKQGQGTGLGLAMVYGTMQSLDGFVDVISKPVHESSNDICTEFGLFFPALASSTAKPAQVKAKKESFAKAAVDDMHILIADDEDMVRDVLSGILQAAGYQTTSCADGEEALLAFEQAPNRYHAAIFDVVMPRMGGPAVVKVVRETSNMPVLLISGYDMDKTLHMVEGLDAVSVLTKPFSPVEILDTVAEITRVNGA